MSAPNLKPRKVPSNKQQMNVKKVQWVRLRRAITDTDHFDISSGVFGMNRTARLKGFRSQSDGMTRNKESEET